MGSFRIFCFLLLVYAAPCAAQHPLSRDVLLTESGTAVQVNEMALDSDGCMWLGTDAGLCSYNGRVVSFARDSLREPVTAMFILGNRIWTGLRNGKVYCYEGGKCIPQLQAAAPISHIRASPYGLLIATEGDGIYCLSGTQQYHIATNEGLPDGYVYDAVADKDRLIAATDRGLVTGGIIDGRLRFSKIENHMADIASGIWALPDGRDMLWSAFQESGPGVLQVSGRQASYAGIGAQWQWGAINDMLPISETVAYAVTETGFLIKINRGEGLSAADAYSVFSLPGKKINRILQDKTGNIWLGTNTGLTLVTSNYLSLLPAPADYALRKVTALCADGSNGLWYALDDVLYRYDLTTKEQQRIYKAPATITSLYSNSPDKLWIGTLGSGLWCMDSDRRVVPLAQIANLSGSHILSVAGKGDELWISSLNGIDQLILPDGNIMHAIAKHHDKREGIGSDYVYHLLTDHKGRIWFATDGSGVSVYDGKSFHRWDSAGGFTGKVVYTLAEDAAGNIWAGTLDHGLFCYNGKAWKAYNRRHGLESNTILSVAANRSGQVYAVSTTGIDVWHKETDDFRHFNRRSGIGIDSISDVLNTCATSPEGNVYIPGYHGVFVFHNQQPGVDINPVVRLTAVNLFFKPADTSNHTYRYDQNHIGFAFESIHFAHAERLRYRYRLEGLGDDWLLTTDESITYPQLPPGQYRFCIQASLSESFDHASYTSYSFTIEAPYWRKWWFLLLIGFSIALVVTVLLQRRVKALKNITRLQRERMEFEYEHLRSQVNPHFLFNSLNTLAGLIDEDKHAAVDYTVQLSDFYRDALSFRSRDLVTLAEEWPVIERYFFIQKNRFGNALQLNANIPEELKRSKRIVPFALQLLIENAIKHNVVSQRHPLVITIEANNETIAVRNPIRRKVTQEKGTGLGLANIRKRYALLSGKEVLTYIANEEFIVTLPLL